MEWNGLQIVRSVSFLIVLSLHITFLIEFAGGDAGSGGGGGGGDGGG